MHALSTTIVDYLLRFETKRYGWTADGVIGKAMSSSVNLKAVVVPYEPLSFALFHQNEYDARRKQ